MAGRNIIWTHMDRNLGWEEAHYIVSAAGGSLFKDEYGYDIIDVLAEESDTEIDETANWIGAHNTAFGWRWMDGTVVSPSKFDPSSVNGDADPSNDTAFVTASSMVLSAESRDEVHSFLWEVVDSNLIKGTAYDDTFINTTARPGQTIRMLGGNDFLNDHGVDTDGLTGGGTIDAGDGDDYVGLTGPGATNIIDGNGSDIIFFSDGVVRASLDGDNDFFFAELKGRVSYDNATIGLVADGLTVSSFEVGVDEVSTRELIGGKGNDILSGYERITGGHGDDTISPGLVANSAELLFGYGGTGNDTLIADGRAKVTLLGEAGNDTFVFRSLAEATGGAGVDRYVFERGGVAKIGDLKAGEIVDLSALLDGSVADAFAGGYLQASHAGGYTYLQIDADGGGDQLLAMLTVKGVVPIADYLFIS